MARNSAPSGIDPKSYLNSQGPKKPIVITTTRAPATSDVNYKPGTLWVDKTNNKTYQLSSVGSGSANWQQTGGVLSSMQVDNLLFDGNTVSSTNENGDINFDPNGTGDTVVASGDVSVTAGNLVLAGDASQVQVKGGAATDFIGQATLSSGTVTVANTNIAATDRIFLSYEGGSISNSGQLSYTISAGTSFTIESTNASDANDVSYFIVRQTA